MPVNLAEALRLLLVTDDRYLVGHDPLEVVDLAVRGGVTAVQLRLKSVSDRELLALARRFVSRLPVPVFINDRMDIAMISGAAGVHLGESDLPPATARRIAPAGFVIGATVGNDEEALRGITADYWGIGPLHGSRTKRDAGAALGMDRATELRLMGRVPAVLIGGVEPSDVPAALAAGFVGVAVSGAILDRPDVEAAARAFSV